MPTIECPNCKRGLRAPDEGGDHRVVCPRCNATFTVLVEAGVLRALSTSVYDQQPEWLTVPMEIEPPPALLSRVESNVYHDEESIRTQRIDNAFWLGFFCTFVCGLSCLFDENDRFGWWEFFTRIPLILIIATVSGVVVAFVGGMVLTPKSQSRARADALLRRMRKADRDEESPSPPAADSSLLRPKDPPA